MNLKKIEKIVEPRAAHFVGDGFRVHNFIPGTFTMEVMDPFIMLDYNSKHFFPATNIPRGVGVHPHRGFETVTIAYHGKIEHADSSGGGGVISEGDVQWMTAASGVLHKEFHETEWSKKGGLFQMVQLWVNLPKKYKMSSPKYQAIENELMKKVYLEDNKSYVEVIAGEYNGNKGPASTFTEMHMYNLILKKNTKIELNFPADFTTCLLAIEGSAAIQNNNTLPENHFVLFKKEGEKIIIESLSDAIILVLSGEPIKEPIAAHGPFVMNTKEELLQAFHDYQHGLFGFLE